MNRRDFLRKTLVGLSVAALPLDHLSNSLILTDPVNPISNGNYKEYIDLLPESECGYNLGSSCNRWMNLYIDGEEHYRPYYVVE